MAATARPWEYKRRNWRNEPDAHNFYITGDRHAPDDEDESDYSTAVAIVCGNATAGTIPEDNAAMIVRSVNCHDELIAFARRVIEDDDIAQGFGGLHAHLQKLRDAARAVLAKSESA